HGAALAQLARPLGRDELINQAAAHLRSLGKLRSTSAVVVFWGQPGMGKSRLAQWLAQFFAADYPDAYLSAQVRAETSDWGRGLILKRWLHQLGEPTPAPAISWTYLAATWQACLTKRRAIVLLETDSPAEQWLPLLPQSSSCIVIVTSPYPPPDLPEVLGLATAPLAPDDAIALLAHAAHAPEPIGDDWGAIAAYCEHIPLALKLAGTRLTHSSLSSPADSVADYLNTWQNQPQHSAKSTAIAHSFLHLYNLLSPSSQALLRRLVILPAPLITPRLAALLLGDRSDPTAVLAELVANQCLTSVGPGIYAPSHNLIRALAKGHLAGEETISTRRQLRLDLGRWYADSLVQSGWAQHPSQRLDPLAPILGLPAAWAEYHWPNLAQVWQWLEQEEDWTTLLHLGLGLSSAPSGSLDPVWWRQCQAQLLALELLAAQPMLSAYLHNNLANAEAYQGNYNSAIALYQQGLEQIGSDALGQAHLLANLGVVYGYQQLNEQQVYMWQQALVALPSDSPMAQSLGNWMQQTHPAIANIVLNQETTDTSPSPNGGFLGRWVNKLFQ
ncbi:hypothetical protein IQ273_21335, partial [Nodosilinea sp. LEGE 07298]|uniref:hypothetical protein n=1 Tax=Nodosilinea sp. LEGE 07298 TaxID=2777970 RepID=UPI00187F2F76